MLEQFRFTEEAVSWLLAAVTVLSPLAQSLTAAYSAEDDTGGSAYVANGSVSGNESVSGNGSSVSGGDMPSVSGSDTHYVLDDFFTGETYVAIWGRETAQVERMRAGDEVTMDLAWDIDTATLSQEGTAEFSYGMPAGVTWAQSEGNIGEGTYRIADGSLSLTYDVSQTQGHINAHLYVTGNAATFALKDNRGGKSISRTAAHTRLMMRTPGWPP